MNYFPAIIGALGMLGVAFFLWQQFGPGSGRALGNRVASHIGMQRSLFYALLDNGVRDTSSRVLLRGLEKSGLGLDEASVQLAPVLYRGIERLEGRFGQLDVYEAARPVVTRLLSGGAQPAD